MCSKSIIVCLNFTASSGSCPWIITRLGLLIPNRSICAAEIVFNVTILAVGHASVKFAAVPMVAYKAFAIAWIARIRSCVWWFSWLTCLTRLSVLSRCSTLAGLRRICRQRHLSCLSFLRRLPRIAIVGSVACLIQTSTICSVCGPRVIARQVDGVPYCAGCTSEVVLRELSVSTGHASVELGAICWIFLVSFAGANGSGRWASRSLLALWRTHRTVSVVL